MFQELIGAQREQAEVGRIRMGTSTPKVSRRTGKEYNEPVKLERFRLTSRNRHLIEAAAREYGGTPEPWQPQGGGAQQWQVLIEAEQVPIMLAPSAVLQAYQLRDRNDGRLLRSCDGVTNAVTGEGCLCDAEARVCRITTWLRVMLVDLPGIGYWRLESHGGNAARELPASALFLRQVGGDIPAVLRMEERQSQVPNPSNPDKEITARYMVPVIHVDVTPRQLLTGQVQRLAVPAAPPEPQKQVEAKQEMPALPALPAAPAHTEPTAGPAPRAGTAAAGLAKKAIAQAATRGQMMAIRQEAQTNGSWSAIQQEWTARAHEIVATEQEQARLTAQTPPAAEPEATTEQIRAAYQALVFMAGTLHWPNTRLNEFVAQHTGGKATWDLTMADLQMLGARLKEAVA